jgi:hypothetical protein
MPVDERHLIEVLEALHNGDFTKRMPTTRLGGPGLSLSMLINSTMQMLQNFAAEHRRITEEIGTSGMLGGQAEVEHVTGTWREMIDGLNRMSVGLTVELRKTSQSLAALAKGSALAKPLTPEFISGECAEMQGHVNALAGRSA